jgi:hypothetical protein
MQLEQKSPGPGRGYCTLNGVVAWSGGESVHIIDCKQDYPTWQTLTNPDSRTYVLWVPYKAPDNATKATIWFELRTEAADHLSTADIDDVEFAETR